MPFSENIKLEAKRRSHFACAVCHQPFVEVHHIIPQEDGGSDDLDNAAPLCARCHDLFGGNPDKRKQLREMRDLWWEICEKRETNPDLVAFNQKLDAIQVNQQAQFAEVKNLMAEYYLQLGKRIELTDTASQFTAVTGVYIPAKK
jgi:hypothetical protein